MVPPLPSNRKLSKVAIPKNPNMVSAGMVGDRWISGPNRVDRVIKKTQMAIRLMAV
jgi:hypothetical protein